MPAVDDTVDCERMQKLALVPVALFWVRLLEIELIVLLCLLDYVFVSRCSV